ncbi:TolC family protein [Endozoicomonas arenosclerae]|uniref:TolC family protein n=1 Tax=Endozoicomonas arenosclerae TaxID=1633495 RepID=UPI000782DAC9|nr:TolC family protein [Endozoicomonas arenosclerae]
MQLKGSKARILVSGAWLLLVSVGASANSLTLSEAEQTALAADPMIQAYEKQSLSYQEQAIADESWADPKVSMGTMNLPGNDLDPANQGMLELKIEQMLPRGDSNQIKRNKTELMAKGSDSAAQNRKLEVLREVRLAWLDTWYWQQSLTKLTESRYLFESLRSVSESMYRQGKKSQQDLISAELGLARLDDRILSSESSLNESRAKLNRWLGEASVMELSSKLPDKSSQPLPSIKAVKAHPLVNSEELVVQQSEQDVALAKEAYKPQWGAEIKYGRSMSDMSSSMGSDSRDQYSLMLMVDIPLFTGNRQDRQLAASHYQREAATFRKSELLRNLLGEAQQEHARFNGLQKRQKQYQKILLPQARRQAESTLNAYQSDASDFGSVMQSYIEELNLQIDYLRLQADTLQSKAKLDYLMPGETAL